MCPDGKANAATAQYLPGTAPDGFAVASLTRESSPDGKPVPGQEEGVLSLADAWQNGRLPGNPGNMPV